MSDTVKNYLIPTGVLAAICLVVSAALSVTYGVTNPIIEENKRLEEQNALIEVLPGADEFTQTTENLPKGAKALYTAGNGAGVAAKVTANGYGGAVVMMIGVAQDGTISGVKILEQSETQGLGSRVMDPAYTGQYVGKSGPDEVDAISGATISSTALKNGIRIALEAAGTVKEG